MAIPKIDEQNISEALKYIDEHGVPIKWRKQSRSSQTEYTYLDGTKIKVNDGNTFIQIEPTSQTLTIE